MEFHSATITKTPDGTETLIVFDHAPDDAESCTTVRMPDDTAAAIGHALATATRTRWQDRLWRFGWRVIAIAFWLSILRCVSDTIAALTEGQHTLDGRTMAFYGIFAAIGLFVAGRANWRES